MQVDKIIKPAKIIDNIRSPLSPLFSCRINFCTVWILDKRFAMIASNAIFTINAYTISLIDTYPSSCLSFTILFTIQECLGQEMQKKKTVRSVFMILQKKLR